MAQKISSDRTRSSEDASFGNHKATARRKSEVGSRKSEVRPRTRPSAELLASETSQRAAAVCARAQLFRTHFASSTAAHRAPNAGCGHDVAVGIWLQSACLTAQVRAVWFQRVRARALLRQNAARCTREHEPWGASCELYGSHLAPPLCFSACDERSACRSDARSELSRLPDPTFLLCFPVRTFARIKPLCPTQPSTVFSSHYARSEPSPLARFNPCSVFSCPYARSKPSPFARACRLQTSDF